MQENDFEKRVQEKMGDFNLRPSEEVWKEVERRIRKEKKRRWIIFWWMFPFLLAGTGVTVYMLNRDDKKIISLQQEQKKPPPTVQENSKKDMFLNDKPSDKTKSKTGTEDGNNIITGAGGKMNKKSADIVSSDNRDISFENGGGRKKKLTSVYKTEKLQPLHSKNEKVALVNDLQKGILSTIPLTQKQDSAVNTMPEVINVSPVISSEQLNETKPEKNIVQFDQAKSVVPASDSAANLEKPVPAIQKNKKGWETGIIAATGLSNRVGGLSLFGANKDFNTNAFPGGGIGTGAPPLNKPTNSRSGLYVEAGIYAQKIMTKKTAFSIEFLVSLFGVRQPRGGIVDSVQGLSSADANRLYRTGNSSVYNSRYYYLQVPLMFHWQLNKGNKVPLLWSNGLSPAWLIGNNALVYNRNAGILYRYNQSLNKVQLSFRSGLYMQFGAGSKKPFSAGLFFNYQLTGLQGSNAFDKNHLSSFNIQIRKTLKK